MSPSIRQIAHRIGCDRAHRWKEENCVPPDDPDGLMTFICGVDAAERLLGESDRALKDQLRSQVSSFGAEDFFAFDPACEPPPNDIPELCPSCERNNSRGVDKCVSCLSPLTFRSHYDIWQEALVTAFTGEIYGMKLGAPYREVIGWISSMRPYPTQESSPMRTSDLHYAFYAVTHSVYTLSHYGRFRLLPSLFAHEYSYLESSLIDGMKTQDIEKLGESMDALYALGREQSDPDIQAGISFLLSSQNQDGSWGNVEDEDAYNRFHTTWTAIDGLREYRIRSERDTSDMLS
jgi:hypothetical protein